MIRAQAHSGAEALEGQNGGSGDSKEVSLPEGYWWRHSRAHLSTRQREEADADWIAKYGREAYDLAVFATEAVLALPYPPSGDLAELAASGKGMRWPWHTGESLRTEEEIEAAREDHARSGALPFASAHARARAASSSALRARTPMALRS